MRKRVKHIPNSLDGAGRSRSAPREVQSIFEASKNIHSSRLKNENTFLLSRGRRSQSFFTEHSQRYISQREQALFHRGLQRNASKSVDAVGQLYISSSRSRQWAHASYDYARQSGWMIERRYVGLRNRIVSVVDNVAVDVSPMKMWKFSIVGAIIFGMLSMSMIYRYFGQGVLADEEVSVSHQKVAVERAVEKGATGEVLGAEVAQEVSLSPSSQDEQKDIELSQEDLQEIEEENEQEHFEDAVSDMVKGYPIESMLPQIFKRDRIVAAYLVAIAKKESNWGKRVPVLNGKECYNYWGYRGVREKMGSGGHTCFDDTSDAVKTVGDRIEWYVKKKEYTTPAKLIVWKCGYTCDGHSSRSVQKWIDDVELYFSKLYKG